MGKLRKQRTVSWGALGVVLAGAFSAWALEEREGTTVVTVNPMETHQVMKGWEVLGSINFWDQGKNLWIEDKQQAFRYRDLILDRLVNELGINRVRITVPSGAENPVDYWTLLQQSKMDFKQFKQHLYEKINDNDDPSVANMAGFQFSGLDNQVEDILLPLKQRIQDNGERLFVALCYVDSSKSRANGNLSHARQPEEFAEFVLAVFDHLKRRYGLIPDAFEMHKIEPDNPYDWGSRETGLGLVAAAKRLRQAGFTPEFIAPSTMDASAAPTNIDAIMAVPGAGDLVTAFSYYRFGVVSVSALQQIEERASRFGKETAMLEHLAGDAEELHEDLTEVNVSTWTQYAIASDDDINIMKPNDDQSFYYFVDIKDPDRPKIRMGKRTAALAQYFKFIRMGATRIGAQSNRPGSKTVAFRNANGTYVVVVNADKASTVSVNGLPSGAYGARYMGGDGTPHDLAVTPSRDGRSLSATVPAGGVITFYQTLPIESGRMVEPR
jgi:hypothetical protein